MRLLLAILFAFLSLLSVAQEYADPSHYLIDSLDLSQLTEEDRLLVDSCLKLYHKAEQDTSKINALVGICEGMIHEDWMKYQFYQYELIKEALAKDTLSKRLNRLMAAAQNNIAIIYKTRGDMSNALVYSHKSLKIFEKLEDKDGTAYGLNNIGWILEAQGDSENALKYYLKSLKIREEQGNKNGLATSLNNIGVIYKTQGDVDKALEFYHKSLKLYQELGHKQGISASLNNIGFVYQIQNEWDKALEYYLESLKIREEQRDIKGISNSLNNIGSIEFNQGDIKQAEDHLTRGLNLAKEVGSTQLISKSSSNLSRLYKQTNRYADALKMYELHIQMRDSIQSEENIKAAIQQQAKYEYEKQQAIKDAEHEKQLALEHKEQEKQQLITYAAGGGLILVLAFLGFVFNRLKVTRKQKEEIDQQKQEIEKTHEQLSEHHKEIQDSINYAKRIQEAIMPSYDAMHDALQNEFVLYEPKDVVAGDFFWMEQINDTVYYAAADCTGHGVPGAMVSVVCSNALTKALLEEGIRDTGKLLDKTRELVINQLAKSGEEVKDGMDISLCAWNKKTNQLQWSGANNPLWIVRKGATEVEETKADKQPIGKYTGEQSFNSHSIQLNQGDSIYVFTDGYQDQFGGPKGKKFKAKQFKQILLDNQHLSLDEQHKLLVSKFREWQGAQEQVDDVCVIGVRI